jgi:indolepyruvate ferredoxin oxidoreductase alpha subunit
MTNQAISGSEALALGALQAGVQIVTGYPGSPSTATVEALLRLGGEKVRVEWAINEKSAFDAALGASLAGARTLVRVPGFRNGSQPSSWRWRPGHPGGR